jgi:putative mRNA 3-end processing factor
VVSHAHADHYPRLLGEVYGHPATLDLAWARYRNAAGKKRFPISVGETFQLGDVELEFLPAGHMLGSCQILIRHLKKGQTVLYSGDFALDTNPTCTPLVYPKEPIDLLICESTFGEKPLHAAPETQMKELLDQDGLPFLIAVYAMGKAQRISALLQATAPSLTVLVHRSILPFHKVYEKHE